jgi:restriction system protein
MIIAFATLGLGLALLVAAFMLRLAHDRRRVAREAQAGLEVLRSLRWKEFANLVAQSFEGRGYAIVDSQRPPGEDGADRILARGNERVLLQVKQGGSYHVGAGPVRALASMLVAQQAQAGVIATSGAFDAEATEAARGQAVTLLAGESLWAAVRNLLPQALFAEAQERAVLLENAARTRLVTLAAVGAALTLAGAGLWLLLRLEGGEPPAASAPAVATAPAGSDTPVSPPAPAPAAEPATTPVAAPPDGADVAQQRDFAAAETLLVQGVASARWSSTSTLVVALRGPLEEQQRGEILREICERVVARDALRFTRLQVEVIGDAAGSSPRWYPCR